MIAIKCFLCGWEAKGDKEWVKQKNREHLNLPRHKNAILRGLAGPFLSEGKPK